MEEIRKLHKTEVFLCVNYPYSKEIELTEVPVTL